MKNEDKEFYKYILLMIIGGVSAAIIVLIIGFLLLWPIFGNFSIPPKVLPDYLSCGLYGGLAVWLMVDKIGYNRDVNIGRWKYE